jgi:EAL domain-containing protein (putative c-di-GMP-specific phosphodiesterase class I)
MSARARYSPQVRPRNLELSENALVYLEALLRRHHAEGELTSPAVHIDLKPSWGGLHEWGHRIRTRYEPAAAELEAAGLLRREPLPSNTGGEFYRYSLPDLAACHELLAGRYEPPRKTRSRLSPLAARS